MRKFRSVCLLGLFAIIALLNRQVEAQPKVYAYCVELGLPGVKPRPVAELANLLQEIGFDGVGYPILIDPQLEQTLRSSDEAGLKVYVLHVPVELGPHDARYGPRSPRPSSS